jgi:hypothetical protein
MAEHTKGYTPREFKLHNDPGNPEGASKSGYLPLIAEASNNMALLGRMQQKELHGFELASNAFAGINGFIGRLESLEHVDEELQSFSKRLAALQAESDFVYNRAMEHGNKYPAETLSTIALSMEGLLTAIKSKLQRMQDKFDNQEESITTN